MNRHKLKLYTPTPLKISQKVSSQVPRFPERKKLFPPLIYVIRIKFYLKRSHFCLQLLKFLTPSNKTQIIWITRLLLYKRPPNLCITINHKSSWNFLGWFISLRRLMRAIARARIGTRMEQKMRAIDRTDESNIWPLFFTFLELFSSTKYLKFCF